MDETGFASWKNQSRVLQPRFEVKSTKWGLYRHQECPLWYETQEWGTQLKAMFQYSDIIILVIICDGRRSFLSHYQATRNSSRRWPDNWQTKMKIAINWSVFQYYGIIILCLVMFDFNDINILIFPIQVV